MEGVVNFNVPLAQLFYKQAGLQWEPNENKAIIILLFWKSQADMEDNEPPFATRQYILPLGEDDTLRTLSLSLIAALVAQDGSFTVGPLPDPVI